MFKVNINTHQKHKLFTRYKRLYPKDMRIRHWNRCNPSASLLAYSASMVLRSASRWLNR